MTRRGFLAAGCVAAPLRAQERKSKPIPSAIRRYSDPTTDLEVYRLTSPAIDSRLPAPHNRAIARNGSFLLLAIDRGDGVQACRLDLNSGEGHVLTERAGVDPESLTLTPDNRAFCYFAGRSLYLANVSHASERELYQVPEGWERCEGLSVGPDGTHATFAEQRGERSRLRMMPLAQGAARTVVEANSLIRDPVPRPMRAQILYRQADSALWLVNSDGSQNRQLKPAPGAMTTVLWAPEGRTLLYLTDPEDKSQLRALRELTPDTNADKLVAKTSQFAAFGSNRDTSVFVGASASAASPMVLLLLRVTRRELTLCEHRAKDARRTCPQFSPDSQRIYFESDREGKTAIYAMHVDKLVEKTNEG